MRAVDYKSPEEFNKIINSVYKSHTEAYNEVDGLTTDQVLDDGIQSLAILGRTSLTMLHFGYGESPVVLDAIGHGIDGAIDNTLASAGSITLPKSFETFETTKPGIGGRFKAPRRTVIIPELASRDELPGEKIQTGFSGVVKGEPLVLYSLFELLQSRQNNRPPYTINSWQISEVEAVKVRA